MTAQIKYFNSRLHAGVGTITANVANTVRTVLKNCFVDGFTSKSITSINRSGTTATVVTSTAHTYVNGQIILIAGAVETAYNIEAIITVLSATSFSYTVAGSPSTPATGTITCKVAPLGWTEVYTGTNKSSFQSPNVLSSQHLFRVEDLASRTMTRNATGGAVSLAATLTVDLRIYETMSDVDTGTLLGTMYMQRAITGSSASGLHVIVVGDDKSAYVYIEATDFQSYTHHFIGDYLSDIPLARDKPSMLMGKYGMLAVGEAANVQQSYMYGHGLGNTQTIPSLVFGRNGMGIGTDNRGILVTASDTNSYVGHASSFSGRTGEIVPFPVYVQTMTVPALIRGRMPGMYNAINAYTIATSAQGPSYLLRDAIVIDGTSRSLLVVKGYNLNSVLSSWAIDITGPWT